MSEHKHDLQIPAHSHTVEIPNIDENKPSAETQNPESEKPVDTKVPYDRFKSKVDEVNALKQKLDEIERERAEKERQELEQRNEYKTLYEQAQEKLEAIKADALVSKKDALLAKAGYTDEQIAVLRGTVSGETDEELTKSIEGLKAVIAPKPSYVDPSPMNGERNKPEQVDSEEKGRNLFKRLRG